MKSPAARCLITLSIALSFNCVAQARVTPKATAQPTPVSPDAVGAPAYILLDPSSGRILAERNAHQRMFPASTTKTMTALLAIESGKLDQVFTIGPNPPKTGEQSIYLLQGEKFKLRDLVRAAMIKSANDACTAIAEAVSGDVPSFAKLMNKRAKELGAVGTNFTNPHGLHHPQHYSTAYDLALIARAAMRYPEFNKMTRSQQDSIHGNWKIGPTRPLLNRNRLLFRWAECDGVKTGYTKQAGRCLIASATRPDPASGQPWRLLSVVLKSPDTWHDSQALLARHGFAKYQPYMAARKGETLGQARVTGGADEVEAMLSRHALLTLRQGEKLVLRSEAKIHQLEAPLKAGQPVGTLTYYAGERAVGVLPLVAKNEVSASMLASVLPASMLPFDVPGGRLMFPTMLLGLVLLGGLKLQSHEKRQRTAARRRLRRVASIKKKPERRASQRRAATADELAAARAARKRKANGQRKAVRRDPCAGEQFVTQFLTEEAESRDLTEFTELSEFTDFTHERIAHESITHERSHVNVATGTRRWE